MLTSSWRSILVIVVASKYVDAGLDQKDWRYARKSRAPGSSEEVTRACQQEMQLLVHDMYL